MLVLRSAASPLRIGEVRPEAASRAALEEHVEQLFGRHFMHVAAPTEARKTAAAKTTTCTTLNITDK